MCCVLLCRPLWKKGFFCSHFLLLKTEHNQVCVSLLYQGVKSYFILSRSLTAKQKPPFRHEAMKVSFSHFTPFTSFSNNSTPCGIQVQRTGSLLALSYLDVWRMISLVILCWCCLTFIRVYVFITAYLNFSQFIKLISSWNK